MRRFNNYLRLLVLILIVGSCKNQKSTEGPSATPDTKASNVFSAGVYYFGEASESALEQGKYNIDLRQIDIDSSAKVTGYFHYQPYGTDGSRGSFFGDYDRETQNLIIKQTSLAEGERFTEDLILPLDDNPSKVDKPTFDRFSALLKQQQLNARINSTDQSRLKQLQYLKNNGFNEEELSNMKFLEVAVDLDNDPSHLEYLLYVMDPMLCGSGGCNLFVLTHDGEVLSRISVSRPPIYLPLLSIEEQQDQTGTWKDLYVYSKGMRQLTFSDGSYTTNASMGALLDETELIQHPERFVLVMDYLD
jgi:hypothetical protein